MTETILIISNIVLVCALITQSALSHFIVQKLLNKLMSRNYYEYASTKKINQKEKHREKEKTMSVNLPPDFNEMGVLDELQSNLVM